MGIVEDTKGRVDDFLSMLGVFQSSPGSAVGTTQENYEGQDLTSSLMSNDIEVQSRMEDIARGTGIGTVGGQTHLPGQGAGEMGVVGAVSHSPASGRVMLPSERAVQLQQVAVVLDAQYQSGQIDQATYQANQAQVIAEAGALARYPSVANMYPVQGTQTKFQAAMAAAQGQVDAYRAAKTSGQSTGVLKLGGNIVQSAVQTSPQSQVAMVSNVQATPSMTPVKSKTETSTFLSAMAGAAKNVSSIITGKSSIGKSLTVFTQSDKQQAKPKYDIDQLVSSVDAKRSVQQNIITLPAISISPGQSVSTKVVQPSFVSSAAISAAKAQLSNNTVNSIIGVNAATKGAVVIPISQQALAQRNLANSIKPNSVSAPVVTNQAIARASTVNTIQTLANSIKSNVAQPVTRTISFKSASPAAGATGSGGAVTYSGGVAYIGSVGSGGSSKSGSGGSSGSKGGSGGAVTYSGGVAYIGSVGKGK